jgi:hypothetical protein
MSQRKMRISRKQKSSRSRSKKSLGTDTGDSLRLINQYEKRLVRIPKNLFASDSVLVDLVYIDQTYQRTNNGFAVNTWRMRMNSVYDPDPALGTGALPGYSIWASIYSSYRVIKFHYDVELCNLEATPNDVVVCPTTADVGANYTNAYDLFANPFAESHALSMTGGMDRCKMRGTIDLGNFYGNTLQYVGNDAFGSGVGTNPGTMFYLNIGGVSANNYTSSKGYSTRSLFTYTTLFTKRVVQTS